MLNAAATQFKLGDDGVIRYQSNATNPLPGEAVARVVKGGKILEPAIEVSDAQGQDADAVKNFLGEWVKAHIRVVLEPLVALEKTDGAAEPVRGICEQLFAAMGIVPREQVESLTAGLDPEMRKDLRTRAVKLGPVLVFLPALNKPAGVRLRGLLWALWNDKALPPSLPHDGIVSFKVDGSADGDFYRAIGYPIYGPRAIRIDMLDRVISAVYDSAKDGKFQAQHKMAEWLGCQIDDLYGVLTAMGHRKIHDPADARHPEAEPKDPVNSGEGSFAGVQDDKVVPQAKPDLAMFALKKGKAFEKREPKPKSESRPRPEKKEKPKKAERKKDKKPEGPRVISSGPKLEDSPFAILEQLKARKDGS